MFVSIVKWIAGYVAREGAKRISMKIVDAVRAKAREILDWLVDKVGKLNAFLLGLYK